MGHRRAPSLHPAAGMRAALLLWAALVAALALAHVARGATASAAAAATLASTARAVPPGGALTVTNMALAGVAQPSTLLLSRYDVVAPGVPGLPGTQPTRFFIGSIQGLPGSNVVLSVAADGSFNGLATGGGKGWVLGGGASQGASPATQPSATGLSSTEITSDELAKLPTFSCGAYSIGTSSMNNVSQSLQAEVWEPCSCTAQQLALREAGDKPAS